MRVYVAAPYDDAGGVRVIHGLLRAQGFVPSSRWATKATVPEDFSRMTANEIRAVAEDNDRDVGFSDAMLVVAREGAGGEMFAEARFASFLDIPIVWTGRLTLSAWRHGVLRCESVEHCVAELVAIRDRRGGR